MKTIALVASNQSREKRGQAMTEFVIWVFVLLLMISGILWFGNAYDLKLQCHLASRYMSWSYAQRPETEMDETVIQARVQAYYPMVENAPEYLPVDRTTGDAFNANSLVGGGGGGAGVMTALSTVLNTVSTNVIGWQVRARYNPGGILDSTLPAGSFVRSEHYMTGGTWHKKQVRGDDAIMTVKDGLTAWSYAVLF
jgi:Flp pilus assembly protein TadG